MAKKRSTIKASPSALNTLVSQFSQPLACLRELVQNSIDAGSNQIEVTISKDNEHLLLKVSDTGEGMTENIIETQLTRLFASAKDGDLTKVGKFGIGFVSIFALDPKAVVVDTGRDGESWRILFKPDRTYELLQLPHQVEGTVVALYLQPKTSLEEMLAKVRETLSFWCRHCQVEITLNGQSILAPFDLSEKISLFYSEAGTRLILGLSHTQACFYGYYNQGLTLLEGMESPIPHLAFKIDSRYFEHTLTRDNVIKNEDFHKGMALLNKVLRGPYLEHLYATIRQEGEGFTYLSYLEESGISTNYQPLFSDHQDQFYSLEQLKQASIYQQDSSDLLSQAIHNPASKRLVLKLKADALKWLKQKNITVAKAADIYGFSLAATVSEEILKLVIQLDPGLGASRLRPVSWPGQPIRDFLIAAPNIGLRKWDEAPGSKPLWLLNIEHPAWNKLLELWQWNQTLSAQIILQYLLLKLPEKDRRLPGQKLTVNVLEALH